MNRLLLFFLSCFLFSCANNSEETKTTTTTTEQTADTKSPDNNSSANVAGCYLRVVERDTLIASLQQDGNNVSGQLIFDNFEKDGSKGTVTGKVDGDIVKLVYHFESEGMNSIAEWYFRKTNDGLIQGFGDVEVKGDSVYYANPNSISYDEKNKLNKIGCAELKH